MEREPAQNTVRPRWVVAVIGLVLSLTAAVQAAEEPVVAPHWQPVIAIIIDDLGYRQREGADAINLPGELTYAVLPHTPHATSLAGRAHRLGKELLLHLPMESKRGHRLGPGGLTVAMPRSELIRQLSHNLNAVPYIAGVSNHMGSRLGATQESLSWIMGFIGAEYRGLYFVDSRTSPDSLIAKTAAANGVPNITRDVFLDHDPSIPSIRRQFARLITLAKKRGRALAIGHPYPETIAVLKQELARLSYHGVRLVPASALLDPPINRPLSTATRPKADTTRATRKPTT